MKSCHADSPCVAAAARRQRVFFRVWVGVIGLGWVAALVNCEMVVPRQGWSEEWGPMVPHESFPGDCSVCHLPESWDALREDFSYDHETETGYLLEGAHSRAACLRCHNDRGPVQAYVARGCGGCHVDPHQGTLGQSCTRCHDQNTWAPGGLVTKHAQTRFPLLGAHTTTPCESCHPFSPVGEYRGAPTQCDACHAEAALQVATIDHAANGWLSGCERCHQPSNWPSADFQHDFFPLLGGHAGSACVDCHTSGQLTTIPSDCWSCHQDDYQQQANHVANGYSQDCTQCHTINGWDGANINHDFFPLVAGHAGVDCIQCHTSGQFTTIPSDCWSCHQDDYQQQASHAANGYSQDCTQCHSPASWQGATVNHDFFPLTAGHAGVDCIQCHTTGQFTTIPSDCWSCHQSDYQGAANHAAKQYPTDCVQCHDTSAWTNSTFRHDFPLTGPHDEPCTTCHQGGNTATFTCLVCHEHSQTSMDDKHSGENGYSYNSQACYDCHPNGKS